MESFSLIATWKRNTLRIPGGPLTVRFSLPDDTIYIYVLTNLPRRISQDALDKYILPVITRLRLSLIRTRNACLISERRRREAITDLPNILSSALQTVSGVSL